MELQYSQAQAEKVLKQRNALAIASAVLAGVALVGITFGSSRDREVVLQPILARDRTITSAGVDRGYLEAVTRDAAVLMLNRTPQSLDYWMGQVLRLAHPSAYGRLKGELIKIVDDQRGSSIAQYFSMEALQVDPDRLTSQVTGVLHTMVGREEVSAIRRTFVFQWTYTGLELRLQGFGTLAPPEAEGSAQADAAQKAETTSEGPGA